MKEYKYDTGKPKLSLVPQQILTDIARIREYGVAKYGDSENWRKVEPERYFDACLRHLSAMVTNGISAIDAESGLPHYAHAACNLAFIAELLKEVRDESQDLQTIGGESYNRTRSLRNGSSHTAEYYQRKCETLRHDTRVCST